MAVLRGSSFGRRRLVTGLAVLGALVAIGYGIHAWLYSLAHVSTDDAYVEGPVATMSAKVAGHVVEVLVDDNQQVKAGAPLLSRPARLRGEA
jgi:membrane fusion protein (multidrug efflux system)